MKWLKGRQRGFTLVELLVAIPIIGMVGLAAAGVLIQLVRSNNVTNGISAIRQVQIAGDSLSRDGLQFQEATSGIAADNVSSGLPFTLTWKYWNEDAKTSESHAVTYSLASMTGGGSLKQLQRREVIKNSDNTTKSDVTTTVGRYIDGSATATNCRWVWETTPAPAHYSKAAFIFTVTAVVGDRTESRAYQVMGRAAG